MCVPLQNLGSLIGLSCLLVILSFYTKREQFEENSAAQKRRKTYHIAREGCQMRL
jgi:hypothetical protein